MTIRRLYFVRLQLVIILFRPFTHHLNFVFFSTFPYVNNSTLEFNDSSIQLIEYSEIDQGLFRLRVLRRTRLVGMIEYWNS